MMQKTVEDGMKGVYLTLHLRPLDNTWVMGDDLKVTFHFDTTIEGVKRHIEDLKGISRHRIQLRPLFKKAGNRIIAAEKEGYTPTFSLLVQVLIILLLILPIISNYLLIIR